MLRPLRPNHLPASVTELYLVWRRHNPKPVAKVLHEIILKRSNWAWTRIASWPIARLGEADVDSGIAQCGGNLAHVPGGTTVQQRRNHVHATGVLDDDIVAVPSLPPVQAARCGRA